MGTRSRSEDYRIEMAISSVIGSSLDRYAAESRAGE